MFTLHVKNFLRYNLFINKRFLSRGMQLHVIAEMQNYNHLKFKNWYAILRNAITILTPLVKSILTLKLKKKIISWK